MPGCNQRWLPSRPQGVFRVTSEHNISDSAGCQNSAQTLHEIPNVRFEVQHLVTGYKIDSGGGNQIPLRHIEKPNVRGGTLKPPGSSQTRRSEGLDPEQLGWREAVVQRNEKTASVAADVQNCARSGTTVPFNVPNQRGPERFVDNRQITIERRIGEKCFAIAVGTIHGHRCDEQLRASTSPAVGSIPK